MSMDIYISVVDAIRCGEFHPQGCDGAGSLSYKFNLLIQSTTFVNVCARYPAAGCQQDYSEEDYKCSFHGLKIDANYHS